IQFPGHLDSFIISARIKSNAPVPVSLNLKERILKPGEFPIFSFKDPVLNIYNSKISTTDSSITNINVQMDSLDPRSFSVLGNFNNKSEFKLIFEKASVVLWPDLENKADTFTIRYLEKSALSQLTLKLDSLNTNTAYILELVEGEQVRATRILSKFEQAKELLFPNLLPGNYKLRLIEDKNQNQRWDAANYELKIQAETVWNFSLPELRADWDIAVTIKP
ncbi:MAG: hypothetical protein WAT16_11255, partial [Saprospiraceae bacterium]